jgi:hypothetical protein
MAQTVSDEELEAKRDKVAKLREQIQTETAKASGRLREQENAVEAAQLDAEAARLEVQLYSAKEAAKVGTVREGVEPVVASAKEQMEAAQAQLDAAKGDGGKGAAPDPAPEDQASASSTTSSPTQKATDAATDKDKE